MIGIEEEDVLAVLKLLEPYLITLGVILVVLLAIIIALRPVHQPLKRLVRGEIGMSMIAATAIVLNLIAFGPMSTLLDLTSTKSDGITETTISAATKDASQIADEGFVLLQNKDATLPLNSATNGKLALIGYRAANPLYGGVGSGGINDLYPVVSLRQGIEDAGFSVSDDLFNFYKNYAGNATSTISKQNWDLPEPPVATYGTVLESAKSAGYSTAVVVLARMAGEGHNDMPMDVSACSSFNNHCNSDAYSEFAAGEHYLQLDHTEKDMIQKVCSTFDKVVLVYNGANPLELGFVDDYSQIKSVIWAPGAGNVGFSSLGKILAGTVNPSGRTTDSFPYDLKKSPWWNNGALRNYSNLTSLAVSGMNAGKPQVYYPSFLNYVEGVYVGYKYWETAAKEGLIDYAKCVQYPFGYGLSYTSFQSEMGDLRVSNGNVSFDVNVTNNGSRAGKDVIECFVNPPYIDGGIEKASANLVAFAKTDLLQPGKSQKITITFKTEEMASYDDVTAKAYVLDAGDYGISVNANSHEVLQSKNYHLDKQIIFDKTARSSDKKAATNRFDANHGDVTYLSRKNHFANASVATAAPSSLEMAAKDVANYHLNSNYDPKAYIDPKATMPTTGASNGVSLSQLRGKKYDDPLWATLLDELTVTDMDTLTAMGGYQTAAIDSIGKVKTGDFDGPAAINNNFTNQGSLGFPIEVVIANTWNQELTKQYGRDMGEMNRELGGHGWYAPGMNTHRTPFTGRNYEYYSEDGVLAGKMAANAVLGAREKGVYSYIKHFALYDFNGKMTCVWADEQAMRETYLRPFEIAVKEGKANAIMVSWSFLGTKWVGECSNLLNDVLRDEWGFQGMVETDFFRNNGHGFMNADIALPNGTDCMLSTYSGPQNHLSDLSAASNINAMRRACHNILFTTVNSWAYEDEDVKNVMAAWKQTAIVVDCVAGVGVLVGAGLFVFFFLKKKKAAAQA